MKYLVKQVSIFLEAIKFEHTLFALPFAYIGAFLGSRGWPGLNVFLWMTVAMIGARTAGMALNRVIDIEIDKRNPRTANRALPKGLLSTRFIWLVVVVSAGLLEWAAMQLNSLCLWLSPIALALLFIYSYTKRFTWFSHIILGLVISCAPIGGWIAATGGVAWQIIILGIAIVFWLAGFDIIYACQDCEFDRKEGLYSIPARFGLKKALQLSALFHFITLMGLITVGWVLNVSFWYYIGCVSAGLILLYQHSIVSAHDLSRLNAAFFTANASLSMVLLFFVILSF